MAAISKPLTLSPADSHLRPFDARRDLQAVADLVELCFADTLDPDGRDYLVRMRSAAQGPPWLNWANTAEWAAPAMVGYVWQEEDRLVGNVSIIPFFIKSRRFFLIANVAVHPDYRKRGIGRLLTERAVQYAQQRSSPSVWLHVREENLSAVSMYQALGFVERARRTSWFTNREIPDDEPLSGVKFVAPISRYWEQQRTWLLHNYPPELSWHLPFKLNLLRPGLVGGWPGRHPDAPSRWNASRIDFPALSVPEVHPVGDGRSERRHRLCPGRQHDCTDRSDPADRRLR